MVFKNNIYRMWKEKNYVWLSSIIILVTIWVSAYVTTMKSPSLTIGTIGDIHYHSSNDFVFENISKTNYSRSNLIRGKYDAYIIEKKGSYTVETTKSKELKETIESILEKKISKKPYSLPQKIKYSTSLNLLTVTLMIISLILFKYYFDERKGINKRILISMFSCTNYVFQHILSVSLIIIIPTLLGILVIFPFYNISLKLSYLFIVLLIVLISTSFTMMLSSFNRKNQGALLIGTMLTAILTLISGNFFTIKNNYFINKVQILLPQTYINTLAENIDKNVTLSLFSIIVLIFMSILFLMISIIKNMKLL
ncbi:MAG: ABC transporter permease [Bacilli bacterium]